MKKKQNYIEEREDQRLKWKMEKVEIQNMCH